MPDGYNKHMVGRMLWPANFTCGLFYLANVLCRLLMHIALAAFSPASQFDNALGDTSDRHIASRVVLQYVPGSPVQPGDPGWQGRESSPRSQSSHLKQREI